MKEVAAFGSLHEFLADLHKKFGPIASFWKGNEFVISIASAEIFKEAWNMNERSGNVIS